MPIRQDGPTSMCGTTGEQSHPFEDPKTAEHPSDLVSLNKIANPMLASQAFRRLKRISFLGILSPRYRKYVPSGILPEINSNPLELDGSRHDHSLAVADLVLNLARRLSLGAKAEKYAVCWALVHDIATMPLSHTCEWGFVRAMGVSSEQLRHMIVTGSSRIPKSYRVNGWLNECGVDETILMELFAPQPRVLCPELEAVWQLVHSPLTPDTLDGIHRAGRAFGVCVPCPDILALAISGNAADLHVSLSRTSHVYQFWQRKAFIYESIINEANVIAFESALALRVLTEFSGFSFEQALELSDDEVISRIGELHDLHSPDEICRFRQPTRYFVSYRFDGCEDVNISLRHLNQLLKRC